MTETNQCQSCGGIEAPLMKCEGCGSIVCELCAADGECVYCVNDPEEKHDVV